ncbi:hypothetical protein CP556_08680 [Natrinema sp. CBA1119]|uniref:hypothetical protein n=1 Tax=Natrinema sp. CBA1119 TaxID=1608465 RepID=UPI000BF52408|nr:hypothetical protein [Natrinema sp. CBA1119]PGF16179.1 hypothetical protein CP556_08680 [Natrinema sp. CBA1119]
MPESGYCTVPDVRRAKQKAELSGELVSENNAVVVGAITSQTEWLEKTTERHWYEPGGIDEDEHGIIPTSAKSRNDEESIPTASAFVVGEPPKPKTWQGSYTRIQLARRHAQAVSELLVRTPDGYEDWTTGDYNGGEWPDALGDDYYVRVNNDGVSQLYLDVEHLLDDDGEPLLESYSNAVYVTYEYGHEGIPETVRKAVALRATAELLIDDESGLGIPENANLVAAETKKQAMESRAEELLEVYL